MSNLDTKNSDLTEKELAEHLSVSVRTLQIWRAQNKAPKHYRHGYKGIRYKVEDVLAWKQKLQDSQETEGV
ncbi:helix-turn-helix domain-containing protein [bacterium]|nr:helix-turn-helix domain-containing protein [bacterium]